MSQKVVTDGFGLFNMIKLTIKVYRGECVIKDAVILTSNCSYTWVDN